MISVIIPAYNHASSVNRCLDSLFQQTGVEMEIIVVNDGSTDSTRAVLERYADRVTVIQQKNLGAAAARNRGAQLARGHFIIFVDADATFEPHALSLLKQALEEDPKAGYAYSDFRFGFKRFRTGPFDANRLKKMNFIHISALIRHELFPGFDESIKRFQDWDVWLTLLERGISGVYVEGTLMHVTIERAGISSWLPKGSYRSPWKFLPGLRHRVQAYEQARNVIVRKHNL
ncbi:hypothetical protein A3B32_02540 [Candidatus Uhrbacteria bacterium RIFCSPLOWO2_01_FULL_53_9]|uniref:Glycosyltransferase 2-like domain-containing protein n=2 Tax=Candidatus Uhriibacteriota TaxID=1752732 RepID=A0A1F7UWL8_9BACT|nr:MAG: hypothetical protein A3C17_01205 [Candidatus Uhrbacteria bacterium RIFCSPHIGHO2_02_FULL_53_13]OGL82693.1 MAG: hypothetical protein A3B32_02540 [Candidatus Uhrbacteria bacterium RIFCSPLOWO2_01_FULL_53_9]